MTTEHPQDPADALVERTIAAYRTDAAGPEAEPTGLEGVDLNPDRCPYTWEPGADTPLGQQFDRVRCTQRVGGHGDNHFWDARQQQAWTNKTRAALAEAMSADPRLAEQRGAKPVTPITVADAGLHEDAIAAFRAMMDAPLVKSREDILEEKLEAIADFLEDAGADVDAATIREALAQLQSYWAQA